MWMTPRRRWPSRAVRVVEPACDVAGGSRLRALRSRAAGCRLAPVPVRAPRWCRRVEAQSGSSMSTRPSPSSSTPLEQAAPCSGAGGRGGTGAWAADRRCRRRLGGRRGRRRPCRRRAPCRAEAGQSDGQCELVSHPTPLPCPMQQARAKLPARMRGPQRNTRRPQQGLNQCFAHARRAGGFQACRMRSLSCCQ